MHHVSADGAHVEDAAEHVARAVGVGAHVAGKKLGHRHAECAGERLHERNIGKAPPRLPLAHGFVGDAERAGELALSEAALLAQSLDRLGCKERAILAVLVHRLSNRSVCTGKPVRQPVSRRPAAPPTYAP